MFASLHLNETLLMAIVVKYLSDLINSIEAFVLFVSFL